MKYKNITEALPADLLDKIQDYIQGEYVYIPRREKHAGKKVTAYQRELQKRDANIYLKVLEGMSKKDLSDIYNLSESSIRRIVLKQREEYEQMKEKIIKILEEWGVEDSRIQQIYDSAWQIGENYVLKVYDNSTDLERNMRMMELLQQKAIPVAMVVSTIHHKKFLEREGLFFVLTGKLPGSNITQFDEELLLATEMGRVIGELHIALKDIEQEESFWENSLLVELKGWIRESFENTHWSYVSKEEFEELVLKLEVGYDNLPVQLIHRDVHFGNFLFDEGKFSGYIDFDLSQRNIRIFDICYFLLGLLCEEEKRKLSFEEWLKISKKVFAGYEEKVSLRLEEKEAIPYVMEAIELLFVAWFVSCEDTICAEDALRIYHLVEKHEKAICYTVG